MSISALLSFHGFTGQRYRIGIILPSLDGPRPEAGAFRQGSKGRLVRHREAVGSISGGQEKPVLPGQIPVRATQLLQCRVRRGK